MQQNMLCPFYPAIAVFLCKRKLSVNVFLGHHFDNAPSKTPIQTHNSIQKGKISQEPFKNWWNYTYARY